MYAFNMENPFWRFIGRLVDLVWINILTVLCCIPVVTAGAAMSAMYKVLLGIVMEEEGALTKGFFRAFRENFKKVTCIWIPSLIIFLILFSNAWLIYQGVMASMPALQTVAGISIGLFAVVIISFLQYFWVLAARYDADLKQTMKNAALLDLAFFPRSLCILVILVSPIALMTLSNWFLWFWFIYGLSFPGYVNAMLMARILRKTEDVQKAGEDTDEA